MVPQIGFNLFLHHILSTNWRDVDPHENMLLGILKLEFVTCIGLESLARALH
jgi:hypothetical protein